MMHATKNSRFGRATLAMVALAGTALGCGPGTAAKAVRGDAPNAGSALGGACGDEPAPWVIDLPDSVANQLETDMGRGNVVLVNYDCESFKIVRGCEVVGAASYAYGGLEGDAKSIEMADSDSLSLNLSGGPMFAAKMESELERGNVFRIDFLPSGTLTTTTDVITRGMLRGDKGKCAKATHFVGSINVGAYTLSSGAAADIGVAAEVFGQGANAKSSSKVKNQLSGGSSAACKGASRDDRTAPKDCRNLLFVQLFPIDEGPQPGPGAPPTRASRPPPPPPGVFVPKCPPGFVAADGGRCVKKTSGTAFACSSGDVGECRSQCDKGNARSCATLGFMYEKGQGVSENPASARMAYEKACDKGDIDGCTGLAYIFSKSDDAALKAKSTAVFEKACARGSGRACSGLGQQARFRRDLEGASKSFDRACSLGYTRGCFYGGNALTRLGRDETKQLSLYRRACFGGDERGCLAAGSLIGQGVGGEKDLTESQRLVNMGLKTLEQECDKNQFESCEIIGDFYQGKYGRRAPQAKEALPFYDKACRGGLEDACNEIALMYENGGVGVPRDARKARDYFGMACDKGESSACAKVGRKAPQGLGSPPGPPGPPRPPGRPATR